MVWTSESVGMSTILSRRWDEEFARRTLVRAKRSGLSDRAFAEREGFDAQRLSWWRRRLGVDDFPVSAVSAGFVEVQAMAPDTVEALGNMVEVRLLNGRVARMSAATESVTLVRLLDAIEGRAC